nr:MAG TPA: hypothetical protein [Caudoviricetes sp.]
MRRAACYKTGCLCCWSGHVKKLFVLWTNT